MRQTPPDRGRHQPQQPDEHVLDEALHDERPPADRADLGAVSEHDRHDGPRLLLRQARRADEHLQVSRVRTSRNVEVSKAHAGKAGRELRQSEGASGSQTFDLPCSDVTLRTMLMPSMASASLVLCAASGTAAAGWASRAHDMRLVCVGG